MNKTYRIEILRAKVGKLISWLMLFALVTVAFTTLRNIRYLSKSKLRIKEAEEKVERIKKENQELTQKKEAAQSLEFKESQIRDKLSMVKEGEIIVILPEPEIVKKFATPDIAPEPVQQPPNWKKWVRLFFKE